MVYLSAKGIVHRDLATRNVLLRERDHLEVSDFGMAMDLFENTPETELPLRWAPIEFITKQEGEIFQYNEKTDVWAFAVTCWEIFTLGEIPYDQEIFEERARNSLTEGLDNFQVLKICLLNGTRLEYHLNCTSEVTTTLNKCNS